MIDAHPDLKELLRTAPWEAPPQHDVGPVMV